MSDRVTDSHGPATAHADGTAETSNTSTESTGSATAESIRADAARNAATDTGSDGCRERGTSSAAGDSAASEAIARHTESAVTETEDGAGAPDRRTALETGRITAESAEDGTGADESGAAAVDAPAGAESGADEPGSTEVAAGRTRRSRRRRLGRTGRVAVSCAAAILLIAAVASSGYFYLQDQHDKSTLSAREQARDTACKYGPVLATYDSKHLDAYFHAVLAGATGDWHRQFDSTSKDLRDVLVKGEVTTTVSDVQCAIISGDATSAQAIVVVGQSISSLGTQGKPEPGQLSISMRLEKDGDRWLVNKVDSPLATPPGS
ncbi:hypothetical protein [Nocardia vaccinii]|uniref:hypothetical protein n=1 Tax=Nocardia vaccinii TaxID=1822 RepID=UPI000AD1CDB9|nr:hypothetical protein [Nocardia vaccinii]